MSSELLLASQRELITPFPRYIPLPRGMAMEVRNQATSRIYSPLDCVTSPIAVAREGSRIEGDWPFRPGSPSLFGRCRKAAPTRFGI